MRVEIRRSEAIKNGTEIVGNKVNIKVVKNKVAPPFKSTQVDIIYGKGISRDGEVLDLAVDKDIVDKSGAASTLKAEDLTLDMFKGYAYLLIEGYLVQDHDMILHAIELAKEAGLQVCLDMASYNIVAGDLEFFTLLINKYVDIVFANSMA